MPHSMILYLLAFYKRCVLKIKQRVIRGDIPIICNFPLVSMFLCTIRSACSLHRGLMWPSDCFLQKQRTLMWFSIKKKGKKKNPHGQHNLMRQSVKGTKWITKCRVGLWVGGWWMKSVIFQHPSVVSLLTGRGKKPEWETVREVVCVGVKGWEDHCARN